MRDKEPSKLQAYVPYTSGNGHSWEPNYRCQMNGWPKNYAATQLSSCMQCWGVFLCSQVNGVLDLRSWCLVRNHKTLISKAAMIVSSILIKALSIERKSRKVQGASHQISSVIPLVFEQKRQGLVDDFGQIDCKVANDQLRWLCRCVTGWRTNRHGCVQKSTIIFRCFPHIRQITRV